MGKPGVLQSMGSQRVRQHLATEQQKLNRGKSGGGGMVKEKRVGVGGALIFSAKSLSQRLSTGKGRPLSSPAPCPSPIPAPQIGSYYGSEITSVDVDEDGVTDVLLVGAPMYFSEGGERGRVYVYTLRQVRRADAGQLSRDT